ncbi:DUF1223 domain-containing protein [Jannaschia sp. Os4]|uniref:DUF1223 domain-containing protein n=1 Tax=Jannaschia sp. Os4 TaxID=2807617 RepID=UPI001939A537|nr:DUF1223 domain-containing protein [Jannaschia sp. Os4]MBM2577894.1 DUF1223 domain-containing protein [Jannaschia sp. Os4]
MRPTLLALALAALAGAAPALADPVVVELFTSQGCSSCPPADALMGEIADRDDVVALAFHVDYWDWIGWADTFADPAFSDRQRAYAAAFDSNMVFTPQFVIGGSDTVAGPDGMGLADTIVAHSGATPDLLSAEGDRLTVQPAEGGGRLTLYEVRPSAEVAILHGENAGRDMTYHRIVRGIVDLGAWDGEGGTMDLPPARDGLARVVVAQAVGPDGAPGAVLGAVAVD